MAKLRNLTLVRRPRVSPALLAALCLLWLPSFALAYSINASPPGSGAIEGSVRSPEDKPVAGALVLAIRIDANAARPTASARSDEKGSFRVGSLAPGHYSVTATAPHLAAAYRSGIEVIAGQTASHLLLSLGTSGATVSGKVTNSRGRNAGAVPILATRASQEQGDIFEALTEADGSYILTLPAGEYTFKARIDGLSGELQALKTGSQRKIDFVLPAGAEPPTPAPPEVVSWIRDHAIPLKTAEAGHGFDDLQPLRKLVGDARIVALGEATHGTREFFQFKHRMLEFLATELGFTVFAIEANWPESLAVNDYVVQGVGDPAKALAGMYFWTWNTEEVLDLILWMRRYNEDPRHGKKLKFYGFDMQTPTVATERALGYLRRVDPEYLPEATRVLTPFRSHQILVSYPRRGADYRDSLRSGLAALLTRFARRKSSYVSRSSESEWAEAEHHTRIVEQAEENMRLRTSESPRDRFMAENVAWLLEREGKDARMMLWAHNGHVSFSREAYAYRPMGAYLRESFGRNYVALGFSFNEGSFQAVERPHGLRRFTVGPAPAESLDGVLARAGLPLFVLDLRRLPSTAAIRDWWYRRQRTRSIGALYSDAGRDGYFMDQIAASNYDGLIFVESTTAARPNAEIRTFPPDLPLSPNRPLAPLSSAPRNLQLESGRIGSVPDGWTVRSFGRQPEYAAFLTRQGCLRGHSCAVLDGRSATDSYGMLMQTLDARPFRGRKVRYGAFVRAQTDISSQAGLWLRVDRKDRTGFVDNMRDRPITTDGWQAYEIAGEVSPDAETISFGIWLTGKGRAWIESVRFETVDDRKP